MIGNASFGLMNPQSRKTAMLREFGFFAVKIRGKNMLHGTYEQKEEMGTSRRWSGLASWAISLDRLCSSWSQSIKMYTWRFFVRNLTRFLRPWPRILKQHTNSNKTMPVRMSRKEHANSLKHSRRNTD